MIQPEELVGDEWAEWYRLTPTQRWLESEKLWQTYLALGGSLDPEPDTQSPFFDASEPHLDFSKQRGIERIVRLQWRADLRMVHGETLSQEGAKSAHFCSMKITEDARKYAAEQGIPNKKRRRRAWN